MSAHLGNRFYLPGFLAGMVLCTLGCPGSGEDTVILPKDGAVALGGTGGASSDALPPIAHDAALAPAKSDARAEEVGKPLDVTPPCTVVDRILERKPADVLLVMDRSTSLDEPALGGADSWWTLVAEGMKTVVRASEASIAWGLMYFPKGKDSSRCCVMPTDDLLPEVEVGIAPLNSSAISDSFDHTEPTGEGTPTNRALIQAANYLKARPTFVEKFLILATDGDPTCATNKGCAAAETKDYERTKATLAHVTSVMGIPVAVVGLAYPDTYSSLIPNQQQLFLNELAKLGGMANTAPGQPAYYPASTAKQLLASMNAIRSRTTSCTFATGLTSPWPYGVEVDLSGTLVARDTRQKEGWDYRDEGATMIFFGRVCESIQRKPDALKPHLLLGCPN